MKNTLLPLAAAVLLAGCASLQSAANNNLADLKLKRPADAPPIAELAVSAWSAPLPHGGKSAELAQWWAQFNDPLLVELIDKAQALSPSLASAKARIASAQVQLASARSNLNPSAGAQLLGQRSAQAGGAASTLLQAGVQASWEWDLFGKVAASVEGADAEVQATQATWHEARVLVAAEVARNYLGLRQCEQQAALLSADVASRVETQRLSSITAKAGLLAPATLALGDASVAEGQSRINAQLLACGGLANALTSLTGVAAANLMINSPGVSVIAQSVATKHIAIPSLTVPAIPADALRQRPDVYRAERDVLVAATQVLGADGASKPTISFGGTLGLGRISTAGFTQSGSTWSLGPVSITMPLVQTQGMVAQQAASRVAYDASQVALRAIVRQAVREVNDALGQLASIAEREKLNAAAATGYRAHFAATQARHRAGLASLVELEDARRIALAADNAVLALEQERVGTWINLYRALGGGWTVANNGVATTTNIATAAKP